MTFREFLNRKDHLTLSKQVCPQFGGFQVGQVFADMKPTQPEAPKPPELTTSRKPALPQGIMQGRRFTSRTSTPKKPSHFLPRGSSSMA